jgi:hypothetical protein
VRSWRVIALFAGLAACQSFGSSADAPPSPPPDAAAPLSDGGASVDGARASSAVEVVVARVHAPTSLFARAGSLYFTDGTKDVSVCRAAACAPTPLVDGPSVKAAVAASASAVLALDTTCGNAMRADGVYLYDSKTGAAVTEGDPCPTAVTAAGDFAFFTSAGLETLGTSWSVKRCTATACEAVAGDVVVSPFGAPKVVAATASDVYVGTAGGRIVRWPNQPNAGPGAPLIASEFFTDLVTDGASLAWLDGKRVRGCALADCAGTVRTVALDATARHLAMDASGLYWTSTGSGGSDGKLQHMAPGATIAASIATGLSAPDGIALDGGFVYFTTHGCDGCAVDQGAILRRPAP